MAIHEFTSEVTGVTAKQWMQLHRDPDFHKAMGQAVGAPRHDITIKHQTADTCDASWKSPIKKYGFIKITKQHELSLALQEGNTNAGYGTMAVTVPEGRGAGLRIQARSTFTNAPGCLRRALEINIDLSDLQGIDAGLTNETAVLKELKSTVDAESRAAAAIAPKFLSQNQG